MLPIKRILSLLILAAMLHATPAVAQQILGNPIGLAQSTTGESSHVFKTSPGYVYSLGATTSAAGWLLAYNAVAAPSNGAVAPIFCAQIAVNSTQFFQFAHPLPMGTGITLAFSSTGCFTQTLANAFLQAQVR